MAVLNKKSRMISFRLSPLEFTSAQADCERRGIRSVSGLARRALLVAIAQHHSNPQSGFIAEVLVDLPLDVKVDRLSIELFELRSEVDRLRQTLSHSRDSSVPVASSSAPGSQDSTTSINAASAG